MKANRLFIVDAFTHQRFKGNPAGVCLMQEGVEEQWMQNIASELNLAETAFCYPEGSNFHLRWFTPTREVELCGHATLATAHVLFETKCSLGNELHFNTLSGTLSAKKIDDAMIMLDFPAEVPHAIEIPQNTLHSLGLSPAHVARNRMDILMHLDRESDVIHYKPNFASIASLPARGLVITTHSNSEQYDIVSRCFYPSYGVNEDPVTGSAHCALAPYWSPILGKTEMKAFQASTRGGSLYLKLLGNRVLITGSSITFCEIILS